MAEALNLALKYGLVAIRATIVALVAAVSMFVLGGFIGFPIQEMSALAAVPVVAFALVNKAIWALPSIQNSNGEELELATPATTASCILLFALPVGIVSSGLYFAIGLRSAALYSIIATGFVFAALAIVLFPLGAASSKRRPRRYSCSGYAVKHTIIEHAALIGACEKRSIPHLRRILALR
jgi:hypothetical protein